MKVRQNGTAWEVLSEAGAVLSSHESEDAANTQLGLLQQLVQEAQRVVYREGALATRTQVEFAATPLRLVETGEGLTWEVCLIEEGWSLNNRYYPWEVLEAAMPLLKEMSAGYYEDEGHTQGDPSLLPANCSGWYEDFRAERGENGKRGIYARFQCIDAKIGSRMAEAWRRGNRNLLGFSIHAYGESIPGLAEGRSGDIVTKIHGFGETTVVRNPAAGGRVVRLVAALNQTKEDNTMLKKWLKARLLSKKRDASGVDGLAEKALCEAVVSELKEGPTDQVVLGLAIQWIDTDAEKAKELLQTLIDGGVAAAENPAPVASPAPGMYEAIASRAQSAATEATSAVEEARTLLHEAKVEGCKTILNQVLVEAKFSLEVEGLVRKQFTGRVFDKNDLIEAVAEYQKAFAPAGVINGGGMDQGQPRIEVLAEAKDKMLMALDLRLGYRADKDNLITEAEKAQGVSGVTEKDRQRYREMGGPGSQPGIKDIYIALTGDTKVRGRYGASALCEATTSDFAYSLGNTINRLTRQFMGDIPNPFDQLFHTNPNMSDMKTQEVDIWGGFADLPVVAEAAAYVAAGFPREERSTYTPEKRGNLVVLTWEMFLNDNLRLLQDVPRKLARATMHTIMLRQGKTVIGNLGGSGINTDTIFDSAVLYHANHRNIKTAALAFDSFIAARMQLEQQYERGVSTLLNNGGTLGAADNSATAVSTTGFQAGMYIQIDAEIIGPLPAPSSGTVFDITNVRGALGTTAATHATNARVYSLVHPLPISKFFPVVPTELRATLWEILNSEKVPDGNLNTRNFLNNETADGKIVPVVVPTVYLGGDINNWYNVAEPNEVPTFEQGFLFNQREGELFVQDAGENGAVFSNDQITYKKRLVSAFKQISFEGAQGNIVA